MAAHTHLATVRHDLATMRADLATVRETATAGRAAVANRLLSLRQRVTDLRADGDAVDLAPLLPWLSQQVELLLAELTVHDFTDKGPVDTRRHEVVLVRPTAVDTQVGQIAETVRPGVLIGTELLRRQQVVAFAAGEEHPADEHRNEERGDG